ncbi:MAG: HAMP domain-containing protein [Nitrospirae bacterium]|nr:HAMP domain-containing protein [Nitrospirota bacterium]
MRNLKILLGLFALSILAVVITGIVLSMFGIEHGPLLIKIGSFFIAVNLVLFLFFLIFSVIKNLLSLYREKQEKIIGSKFSTRLVVAFVGLTLIPSVLLFILSNQLINNSIDKCFALEIQKPIDDSMEIARTFYSRETENVKSYAALLASDSSLIDKDKMITNSGRTYNVYSLNDAGGSDFFKNVLAGAADAEIIPTEPGDVIRAAAPFREGGRISGIVVVETLIPKDMVAKLETIKKAYNEYHQLRTLQRPVKFLYFLVLTIATLLIIFLALWAALRIAKGITVPIKSLAEATNAIAQGDLDYRISLRREDEIGLLITSFNEMVRELKDGKLSLEKAYTESDRRRLSMEAILENINSGVIFLERSGKIATLNNAACSMLMLDRDDIIGKSHKEILGKIKSEDLNFMVNKLEDRNFKFTEGEIHAYIDSRPVNLRVYITVLKDSKDNFIGILVVFDDLTDVINAQRAIAWQEVAKRIAHEIKNPLTPIKLSTERLLKKWEEKSQDFDEVFQRAIKTIVKEVDSLRNLVDEFSKFGKMPKINLQPANINSILGETLELYKDMKDIKIITSLEDIQDIDVDREQFKRAIINLIDNAIQAKTDKIWLNTSYDPALEVLRIEVADDGIGIKEEEKDKLFLPYFSTKKDGTGLGLAIVSSIIAKHRGYIRVKDNEPKGTRFIIELPVEQK